MIELPELKKMDFDQTCRVPKFGNNSIIFIEILWNIKTKMYETTFINMDDETISEMTFGELTQIAWRLALVYNLQKTVLVFDQSKFSFIVSSEL